MEITDIKILPRHEEKLKAYVTITFDDAFVVRNLKIIEGSNGLFVAMPSRKRKDGTFMDIAHPLNNDMRKDLEEQILAEYGNLYNLGSEAELPGTKERQEAFERN